MKYITNIFKNKEIIIYLFLLILVMFIVYYLFSYKEGLYEEVNTSNINNKIRCNVLNKNDCLTNIGKCDWNYNLYQCSNKHNCYDITNNISCNNEKYCSWNNSSNTCSSK